MMRPGLVATAALALLFMLVVPTQAQAQEGRGICGRTEQVRTAILERIDGVTNCALVTDAHLGAIEGTLRMDDTGITSLRAGDFAGLSLLTELILSSSDLSNLPEGVFSGLSPLKHLVLSRQRVE